MTFYDITEQDKELIQAALKTLEKNFDDGIYNHTVGAAVRCKNGNIYKGINCDGIHGSCAEYITIGIAISNGEREFDTIVAVKFDNERNAKVISPCGLCRYTFDKLGYDLNVIVEDIDHDRVIKMKASTLLPYPYKR